jgi:hypothetical protein
MMRCAETRRIHEASRLITGTEVWIKYGAAGSRRAFPVIFERPPAKTLAVAGVVRRTIRGLMI